MLNRLGNGVLHAISGVLGSVRDALEKLIELPRNIKQALLLALDMVFVSAAMWSAVALRHGS
ncbi:MAG TPA: hypothetical protein DD459_13685, partial [Halieaceae bacterium]|nr:hypothetical protein [Halieaceae bacterium]